MSKKQPPSFWQAANKMTQGMKEAIAKQAAQAGQAMSKTASDVKEQMRDRATDTAQNLTEAIGKKATAVSTSASQTSQTWIDRINPVTPANSSAATEEVYHVFIGYELAQTGGHQKVTLKSGKSYDIKINPPVKNGCQLRLKKCGLRGNDAFVTVHTLFDESVNIYRLINQPVAHSSLQNRSKTRCSEAYSVINAGRLVQDLPALDLLDFIVGAANLPKEIYQRYIVASQNSRLVALEECLEETLSAAYLNEAKQRLIKGAYQFIRAGEAVPNLTPVHQLDAMMLNSYLAPELMQRYLIASAISVCLTVDGWLQQLITGKVAQIDQPKYLSVYQNIRSGESVDNLDVVKELDGLILTAAVPELSKVIYKLARDRFFVADDDFESPDFFAVFQQYQKTVKLVQDIASKVSISSETGEIQPSFSSFSENSVSEGKLGLLGEFAIPQQGIGLIRAAVLCAIASVSEMETQAKIYLGITQPETPASNQLKNFANLYEQIMLALDRAMYPQLHPIGHKLGIIGNLIGGQHPEQQKILRELEQRLDY